MERIYKALGIKEMKINQFNGNEQSDLGKLLPTLGLINTLGAANKWFCLLWFNFLRGFSLF